MICLGWWISEFHTRQGISWPSEQLLKKDSAPRNELLRSRLSEIRIRDLQNSKQESAEGHYAPYPVHKLSAWREAVPKAVQQSGKWNRLRPFVCLEHMCHSAAQRPRAWMGKLLFYGQNNKARHNNCLRIWKCCIFIPCNIINRSPTPVLYVTDNARGTRDAVLPLCSFTDGILWSCKDPFHKMLS